MTTKITLDDLIIPKFDSLLDDILDWKWTHVTLVGGRGSTKSTFAAIAIILLITRPENKNCHVICFRKVANTLKDSVYANILFAISLLHLDKDFKVLKNPMEITYVPTGQKILFRGLDDAAKIKSIKPTFGYFGVTWFEELSEYHGREEIRSVLQSTMRGVGGKFLNIENFNPPVSRDHWVNVDAEEPGRADRIIVRSSYKDVPVDWLSEQFVIEANTLKAMKPIAYDNEYGGIATGTGGNIFENAIDHIITDKDISRFDKIYQGLDFGFSIDEAAWVEFYYDKKKRKVYIFNEIFEPKLSNRLLAEKIKEKRISSTYITADSQEPKSISELQSLGLNVYGAKKGADSVHYGIRFLQNMDEIIIDKRRCPNTYREFIKYEYQKDKHGNFISSYPDKNNHTIDAMRYALESEMLEHRQIVKTSNQRLW